MEPVAIEGEEPSEARPQMTRVIPRPLRDPLMNPLILSLSLLDGKFIPVLRKLSLRYIYYEIEITMLNSGLNPSKIASASFPPKSF